MISREEINRIVWLYQKAYWPNLTEAQKARLQTFLDDEENYNKIFKDRRTD